MAGMTISRRGWLKLAGPASVVVGATGGLLAAHDPSNHPSRGFQNIPPRELIQRRHLPNVELTTQDGKKVRFYDDLVRNKVVTINFMYAHCEGICPTMTANLVRVQKILHDRIGHDIFMYSITLKPEEDTPQALKEYADVHGAGPGWLFLTGKPADIELLRRSLGFSSIDPEEDANKSTHTGMLRIGNEPMLRWSACPSQTRAQWIATSILAEADDPLKGGASVRSTAAARGK
jgi:protein SCO1